MGLRITRFVRDERGTSFEGIALSVSIIAVAFVASADMLDYMTKPKNQPTAMMATLQKAAPVSTANRDLDDTPTASVPHLFTRSVLDPCTGRTK